MAATRQSKNEFSAFFSHPAVLILLTALLTGLLAPWITNRWTERDKKVEAHRLAIQQALDVKSKIVDKIGTTSAGFLGAVETGRIQGRHGFVVYRALKIASFQVGSQLAAYFHETDTTRMSQPMRDWLDYTYNLRNTYELLTTPSGLARNHWLKRIEFYFNTPPSNYRVFKPLCKKNSSRFQANLRLLVLKFENREQRIVSDVAASPTVLTGTPFPYTPSARHYTYGPLQKKPCSPHQR
jgi:hypothetical protein